MLIVLHTRFFFASKQLHDPHGILIYGYDCNNQVLYYAGFNEILKYSFGTMTFEDFKKSFSGIINFKSKVNNSDIEYYEYTYLLKPKENVN